MNPSRATLATTGLLLTMLLACTEHTVVPTEPSRDAPLTSIPGSSSATVRSGREADRFIEATAAEWAAKGDSRLTQYLGEQSKGAGPFQAGSDARNGEGAIRQSISARTYDQPPSPSPTTTPNAVIYYSSTAPFASGSSGIVVASVTYFGNIATTDIKYSAISASGAVVIPESKATNRGLGDRVPCMGSAFECSWTFKLQTVLALNLVKACDVTLAASSNHRAEWTMPAISWIPGSTWGTTFSAEGIFRSSNDPCVPRQVCLDPSASNYGGTFPCTYPPPVSTASGGDGSTTPPSTGTVSEPEIYQPAPFVPSGHWECRIWYEGTDYQREYCNWYADYTTRLPTTSVTFARLPATDARRNVASGKDLPSVFVIVSDKVPADAMAILERHKQGPYRNVLLVPSSAIRPAVLVAALRALSDSRGKDGETPAIERELTLTGSILDQQIPAAARSYAASFAALLAKARAVDTGAYGTSPVLEIRLGDRK